MVQASETYQIGNDDYKYGESKGDCRFIATY